MAWRIASHRDGLASACPTTATALSCPTYAGTRGSTHGERKLRRPAPTAMAIVRSTGSGRGGRVARDRVQEAPQLADGDDELDALLAQLHHRNALEIAAIEVRIGLDVALDELGHGQPAGASVGEDELDRLTRLVAKRALRARVQDEIGEGSHARHRTA